MKVVLDETRYLYVGMYIFFRTMGSTVVRKCGEVSSVGLVTDRAGGWGVAACSVSWGVLSASSSDKLVSR